MNINRLLIIDKCLKDTDRRWTLNDLIDACAETESNSRRSVQADLELMRKSYFAPIVVVEKKYYVYQDNKYSLLDQLLTKQDESYIQSALDMLDSYIKFRQTHSIGTLHKDMKAAFHDALHPEETAQYHKPIVATCSDKKKKQTPISTVRLWISDEFASKLQRHPINKSQQTESIEIDGSVNLVVNVELTHEFEYMLLMNEEHIRVIEPQSLVNKIKKLKEK